ncbi:MAG: LysM peptidoglycan-binding domain-containing protein [Cytophagales bacterium]|nr:MAG: LysM peptidoglycan-binding domain-containing protein [Cytophagales bacterium]
MKLVNRYNKNKLIMAILISLFTNCGLKISAQSIDTLAVDLRVYYDSVSTKAEKPWFANTPEELVLDRLSCLQKEIKLNYNRTIKGFINYFTLRKPHYCLVMERRRQLYFPIFEEILKKNGVPEEMKYLAIVESGLNPRAVSRVGAVGLWQFMPLTGRQFGLTINEYIDERMDPYKSTEAACKYLNMAFSIFKDWELSIASYNCGMGHVRRSIRRSGYADNFWEVYDFLPQETRSYVPQYVAVNYTMNYLTEHKIFADSIEAPIQFQEVKIANQYVNFEILCRQLDFCIEDFYKLNPVFQKNYLPASIAYPIRIPHDKVTKFYTNYFDILDSCSRTSNIGGTPPAYVSVFGKKSTYTNSILTTEASNNKQIHTVRKGQTIYKIASIYNVSINQLKQWNKLKSNRLKLGQKIVVFKPAAQNNSGSLAKAPSKKSSNVISKSKIKIHEVQSGDTLWNIAQKYEGVSVEKIKKLNKLKSNELKIGQKLILG